MRRRPLLVAQCQAFHLLAGAGAEQQGLRRQDALVTNAPVRRPGCGTSASCVAVGRTDTALGAFYRRLSSPIGKAKAVPATARKVAVLFYNAVRHGMEYVDPGASSYETRYRTRVVNNLHRRAKAFGFVLQPLHPKPGAAVLNQGPPQQGHSSFLS